MALSPSILIAVVFAMSALGGFAFLLWRNARETGTTRHAAIAGRRARDGIVVQDERGRILWANPAYCDLMGRTEDEILGRNPLSFCFPERDTPSAADIDAFRYDDGNPVFAGLGAAGRTLYRNRHSSGRLFWNRITLSFHRDRRNRLRAVLVCRDVTAEIEIKEELERKTLSLQRSALYDPLTEAANRKHLEDYVTRLIARDDAKDCGLALIHFDLDRFKDINDRYGHAAGDAALLHASQMASSVLRQDDLLARIGGDEFAIACLGVMDKNSLRALAEKVARAVREPLDWKGHQILCCTSVGAAFYDGPGDSFERMLGRADLALYEVKRTGRGETALFDRRLASSQDRRSHWTDALRKTIDNGHLKFRFQPVIDMARGTVHSIEAQPFWKQPDGSLLRPRALWSQAEHLGLRPLIDIQTIRAAARLQKTLSASGFMDVGVSLALSPSSMDRQDFIRDMQLAIANEDAAAQSIIVELDTAVLGDSRARAGRAGNLSDLAASGQPVIAGQFCGSFAGLRRLCSIAPIAFKLAPEADLLSDDDLQCRVVLQSMFTLARALDHRLIVGDVHDTQSATLLEKMGDPLAQGDHICRPMVQDDVVPWLLAHSSAIAPARQQVY
ncbi:MAG: diguanylate cyclase [Loktanella sp.]|nr:diguanylate cyclase [Loktanella sp.]